MCSVAQSCPTLCHTMDCGPPGSSGHGILQARVLNLIAISSSRMFSDPGIKSTSPVSCTAVDYFPTEPPGKPRADYGEFQNEEIGSWCLLLHFSVLCPHPPLRYFPMGKQHKEMDILQFAGWGLLALNLESIKY